MINTIQYGSRKLRGPWFMNIPVQIDVKDFIFHNDETLKNIIEAQVKGESLRNDDIVTQVQQYVVKKLIYGPDTFWGAPEFWLFPPETLVSKHCDCEDGAILICSLLRNAGISSEKVWVSCGLVESGKTKGGHGYCCYQRDLDSEIVIIDWCFLEDSKVPVQVKKPFSERKEYKDPWFSFNDENCWIEPGFELTLGKRVRRIKC